MRKINKVAVVGLGYVGSPLAFELAKYFDVVGYDINSGRVAELLAGHDRTGELAGQNLQSANWSLTSDAADALGDADVVIVTVPTPVTDAHVPDLKPVTGATETIAAHLAPGATVIYESTVYPGVTEDICVPILEQRDPATGAKRRQHGCDFWVAYSPERINPGDKVHTLTSTPKIVSGDTAETLDLVDTLYSKITSTYRAGSIKVAEAAKVIENTQRDVNIALMNELSEILSRLDIDTLDAIDAAASKWNFHRYVPGFVGGHCISVDPYYLTHRSTQVGYSPSLILAAREVNDKIPALIARKTLRAMHLARLPQDSKITVLGITFKENVPDIRNSKAVDLVREFMSWGFDVQVVDPLADPAEVEHEYGIKLTSGSACQPASAVVLAVAHDDFVSNGWDRVLAHIPPDQDAVVADVKGALPRQDVPGHITLVRA
ncbi:MAG: nucleotide sugar dehydrogenase [Burkholderiaceae bacterium]|jgi:UDP-N-acetyl-D-galactosamine dehydrogenase|nr:nucleotide sugar dehydrogenase [Burkholderiaceae bacterium]